MEYKNLKGAGIYAFRNKINGKYYIGQSISLKNRIRAHLKNFRSKKYDLPIYRAFHKYGLDNFDLIILEEDIELDTLDLKEKEYIDKYNSYTEGYNCTIGGDAGVTGYKLTTVQYKEHCARVKQSVCKLYKTVYIYDTNTKNTYTFISITHAANFLNLRRESLSKALNGIYHTTKGFIASFSKEELTNKMSS